MKLFLLPALIFLFLVSVFAFTYVFFYKDTKTLSKIQKDITTGSAILDASSEISNYKVVANVKPITTYATQNNLYEDGAFHTIFGDVKKIRVKLTNSLDGSSDYTLSTKNNNLNAKLFSSSGIVKDGILYITVQPEPIFLSDVPILSYGSIDSDIQRSFYLNQLVLYYLYAYDVDTSNLSVDDRTNIVSKYMTQLLVNMEKMELWPVVFTKL